MSIDVEDYFQVSAFDPYLGRDDWDDQELRVEQGMRRLLRLFELHQVKATFFTLGWIAERRPQLIREVSDAGHEIASHGWQHIRADRQSREEFARDAGRTKAFLEDLTGAPVFGYRAASYSIGSKNLWAQEVLAELGYRYSSSICPVKHDHYGIPDGPRFPYHTGHGELIEFPVTTVRLGGRNWPCAGGGWFRLLPFRVSEWALRRVSEHEHGPVNFYLHPWELDPGQPRREGLSAKTRFRHYLNLAHTERRLDRLLGSFEWRRMDEVLAASEILTADQAWGRAA